MTNLNGLPFGSSLDTSRLLAQAQFDRSEDRRTLIENAAVRTADLFQQSRQAMAEYFRARANAQAAMTAAQAAMAQANELQQAAEQAKAAIEQTLAAVEKAQAAAAGADQLAEALAESNDPAAYQAAVAAAAKMAADAEALAEQARELIDQLAELPVNLELDDTTLERLRALWAAGSSPFADSLAPVQPTAAGLTADALVVLPADDAEPVAVGGSPSSAGGATAEELATLLAGLEIPADLQGRVDQVRTALAQIDALDAQGLTHVAAQMRQAWAPIIAELFDKLGVVAAANNADDPVDTLPVFATANDHFHSGSEPIGGGFYGVGDAGRTGQDSLYEWLPHSVAALASASAHGHYLLASSDQVTTLEQHLHATALFAVQGPFGVADDNGNPTITTAYLTRDEALLALREQGLDAAQSSAHLAAHECFLLAPPVYNSEGSDTPAMYGTRAQVLQAIGLPADAPLDLQIAFNNSGSGGGDAWLDATHADGGVTAFGAPQRAYNAVVDDALAADWVQIGDIGPLGDDIGQMLGEVYEQSGATTELQREMVRSMLFRYDERYGILANREFIAAAVETNNNRRQGFFEKPLGRALLMVAASFLPGGQYISMGLSAGFSLHDGASFGDVLRNAAIGYFASTYGDQFGALVSRACPDLSPAVAAALDGAAANLGSTALRQILSDGRLDVDALLLAALSGGAGAAVTHVVANSDLGRALDRSFGHVRASDVLGRLSASVAAGGRLDLASVVAAFSASAPRANTDQPEALLLETPTGQVAVVRQGDEVYTVYDDGSILLTFADADGQVVYVGYDADGNIANQSNVPFGAVSGPNDGPHLPVGETHGAAEPDPDNVAALGTPELYEALRGELAALRDEQRDQATTEHEEQLSSDLADLPRIRALIDAIHEREAAAATPSSAQAQPGSSGLGATGGGATPSATPVDYASLPVWVNPNPPDTGGAAQPGVYFNLLPSSQSAPAPNWFVQQFNQIFGTEITPSWTQFHLPAYTDNPLGYLMAPGTLVIAAHGNSQAVGYYSADNYNVAHPQFGAADLAYLITTHLDLPPDTVIVVAACDTGRPGGLAEQLSRLLPNPVVAPPDLTTSNPLTGTQYVTVNPYAGSNNFLVYQDGHVVGQTPVVYGQRPGG